MAGAMVEGWRRAGVDFSGVTVIRPSGYQVAGIATVSDYPADVEPRFVMLGFKPQKLDEVMPDLAPRIGPMTTLVSMLAGVSAATLRAKFPTAGTVVRVMPNLPVAEGEGVTALYSEEDDEAARSAVESLMAALGIAPWCSTESEFSAIGALAASGPAYLARFVTALARAAEESGLGRPVAERIAAQMMIGTGAMVRSSGIGMEELARRVASPKGTTEQALAVLDGEDGLQPLADRAIEAAIRRGRELAAEARGD
jgi:pyrroline-5-carboxylate reductase